MVAVLSRIIGLCLFGLLVTATLGTRISLLLVI